MRCDLSCIEHLLGSLCPKIKLHPKGRSSKDHRVKPVIESLSFQSLRVSKHKTTNQNRVFTDLPGKEKK